MSSDVDGWHNMGGLAEAPEDVDAANVIYQDINILTVFRISFNLCYVHRKLILHVSVAYTEL